jgi:predicted GTPase
MSLVNAHDLAARVAEGRFPRMCLVDTPGLGSAFQGNTEETRAFVPHIDAALVVLGVDPPISADELALVSNLAQQVGQLVFVLNKVDRLNASDLAEARRFSADILTRQLHRPDECLFEVSATERLNIGVTRD